MDPSLLLTLIKAIVLPIIGIFLATKCNLFDHITFVPDEYAFEAGLTAYFALLEFLYYKISRWIENNFINSVKCIFYTDKMSKNIENTPRIEFTDDVAYVHCLITLDGAAKNLAQKSLIISFPNWVEVQESNGSISIINEKNQLIIDFNKLVCIDNKKVIETTADIKIGIIKCLAQDNYSMIIVPTLSHELSTKFTHNKFELHN